VKALLSQKLTLVVYLDVCHAKQYHGSMRYKGYIGRVKFDDDARIFHGKVAELKDIITFQG
jgi:hypothetical protein